MKDQGIQSPQTFLAKNLFSLQLPRKHGNWGTDHRYKEVFSDLHVRNKNGNVHYYFKVKFNFWIDWRSHGC